MTTIDTAPQAVLEGGNVLDGTVRPGTGGMHHHRYPVDGELIAETPWASPEDVDSVVTSAHRAFADWRNSPAAQRRAALLRLGDLVLEHAQDFNAMGSYEIGAPFTGSDLGVVGLVREWLHYYAGWADKIEGTVPQQLTGSGHGYVRLEPLGVIAAIVPFNGGLITSAMKAGPALAAGNTVVIKPSEVAPFAPVLFAKLATEAGFPPGVVSVVQGDGAVGDALSAHPLVRKISFTGGAPTARKIMQRAAERLVPVITELGGKSANILFPDADLDTAVGFSCVFPLQMYAGQNCQKPSRLFVHESIYNDTLDRLVAIADSFVLGDPFDGRTTMGPVVLKRTADSIVEAIEQTVASGEGRLLRGGDRMLDQFPNGNFVTPAIVADVDNNSRLAQEEFFGPVLAVLPFSTEEEVVAKANHSDYGLSAYIQTNDIARAHRIAAQLESGMVNINGFYNVNPGSPFGGYKTSGVGREGGRWGIDEYLQTKNVHVQF